MEKSDIEALKEDLNKNRAKVNDGTVITFVSGGKYTYAAIYKVGKWYVTGNGAWWGTNVFDHNDFIERVTSTATDIKVATAWEDLS